jgi:hypothetical protein
VTHSHCGTCRGILALLEAAVVTSWSSEERVACGARAKASIKESERARLRMPRPSRVQ